MKKQDQSTQYTQYDAVIADLNRMIRDCQYPAMIEQYKKELAKYKRLRGF